MPRRSRLVHTDVPLHVIQRGNNRQACFFDEEDRRRYLEWLAVYSAECGCRVHAYVLMTNHVHLLLTPSSPGSAGRLMKRLGQRYVQHVNRTYRRSGTLWEGRFRSCPVQEDGYLLRCYRYIELNPVRAGMVSHPGDYSWSSYAANASGDRTPVVTPHPLYLALGKSSAERRSAYRALFRASLPKAFLEQVRRATNGNFALGEERFQAEISAALGRRVVPGHPGRPRNRTDERPSPDDSR